MLLCFNSVSVQSESEDNKTRQYNGLKANKKIYVLRQDLNADKVETVPQKKLYYPDTLSEFLEFVASFDLQTLGYEGL